MCLSVLLSFCLPNWVVHSFILSFCLLVYIIESFIWYLHWSQIIPLCGWDRFLLLTGGDVCSFDLCHSVFLSFCPSISLSLSCFWFVVPYFTIYSEYSNTRVMRSLYFNWVKTNQTIFKASSRGLVVKAEDSWLKGRGFKHPTEENIFHAPFIWIKSVEQKGIMEFANLPSIVACAVIPLMGGWTLRTVGS